MASLYIHIPFCKKRCHYCDFTSYEKKENLIDKYLQYLEKESNLYSNAQPIETVYIGGGTPSLLNEKQLDTVGKILDKFELSIKEFSIEINPDSIDEAKLKKYKKIGINRLSIGLQSTNNKMLKVLSRRYTYEEFLRIYKLCRKYFDNINVDMMYALPYQSFEDFKNDIKNLVGLDSEHISIYELHLKDSNTLKKYLPKEDVVADMYEYLLNNIVSHKQYEISNWAKKGFQCKHNLSYWKNYDYVGLGLSAGGHLKDLRYINVDTFGAYFKKLDLNKHPYKFKQKDHNSYIKETIIMNLRLFEGLDIKEFNSRFNKNFIDEYKKEITELLENRLCVLKDGKFKLTKKGFMVSNRVYEYFI